MAGLSSKKAVGIDYHPPVTGGAVVVAPHGGPDFDPLVIDLNLRLMSGQADRLALEASCEQAGVVVDDEGKVTLLRLP